MFLLSFKFVVLYVFLGCATYVHFRGKVRHPFTRQLTDHSTVIAPFNCLMYLFSSVPNEPILDRSDFPELDRFRDNWESIRDEALALYDGEHIKAAEKHNDLAFNTFFKRGWKRFYLKWYDPPMPSAKALCPKTLELVESLPSINAALFTMMEPQSSLGEHRDPFGGSLRYHLGLATPNSDRCRITVDGHEHAWHDGEDILFDETFIHRADNATDERRIILFLDVTRPLNNPIARALQRVMIDYVVRISKTQNTADEKVGLLNRVSSANYRLKLFFRRIKEANRPLYYTAKYIIFAALIYLIFFPRLG